MLPPACSRDTNSLVPPTSLAGSLLLWNTCARRPTHCPHILLHISIQFSLIDIKSQYLFLCSCAKTLIPLFHQFTQVPGTLMTCLWNHLVKFLMAQAQQPSLYTLCSTLRSGDRFSCRCCSCCYSLFPLSSDRLPPNVLTSRQAAMTIVEHEHWSHTVATIYVWAIVCTCMN